MGRLLNKYRELLTEEDEPKSITNLMNIRSGDKNILNSSGKVIPVKHVGVEHGIAAEVGSGIQIKRWTVSDTKPEEIYLSKKDIEVLYKTFH